mmetsp:Transcript_5702/g.9046  ORF Transcript_5702/g.9046 Transcript_5702/m.9046 type:complete len:124 (+) Transcript_5702:2537-2908(+)
MMNFVMAWRHGITKMTSHYDWNTAQMKTKLELEQGLLEGDGADRKKTHMFAGGSICYLYRNLMSMEMIQKEKNEYTILDYQKVFQHVYDFVIENFNDFVFMRKHQSNFYIIEQKVAEYAKKMC